MIAKLTGIVEALGPDRCILDVSGVGYLVQCSGRTLGRLTDGEVASLLVDTQIREDRIQLYGFGDRAERDWFRLLTTVQGVGPRMALSVLGVLAPDELAATLAAGDRVALTRASGVGPKIAARIIGELREKVSAVLLGPRPAAGATAGPSGCAAEAISALVNLGYSATQSLAAVSHAARRLGADAATEALVRAGLRELAPREHGARELGA